MNMWIFNVLFIIFAFVMGFVINEFWNRKIFMKIMNRYSKANKKLWESYLEYSELNVKYNEIIKENEYLKKILDEEGYEWVEE